MRIFFVINTFDPGGAERVASLLVNLFSKSHQVCTITRQPKDKFFYDINPNVEVFPIITLSKFEYVAELRNKISKEKPDLIISFMTEVNILALIAFGLSRFIDRNSTTKIHISERTDPTRHKSRFIVSVLRFLSYRFATRLILQTDGIKVWAKKLTSPAKISVIPNPVDLSELKKFSVPYFQPEVQNYILNVGRFTVEKGQKDLIDAFNLIKDDFSDLNLIFIGEGPEKEKLQQRVQSTGLANRVFFLENKLNIYDYLINAKLYVLSSQYEGFPNVLLESLACGTVSISYDCNSGPSDLLRGEMSRFLVKQNNPEDLAKKISEVINDKELKKIFLNNSKQVLMRYSTEKISKEWLK